MCWVRNNGTSPCWFQLMCSSVFPSSWLSRSWCCYEACSRQPFVQLMSMLISSGRGWTNCKNVWKLWKRRRRQRMSRRFCAVCFSLCPVSCSCTYSLESKPKISLFRPRGSGTNKQALSPNQRRIAVQEVQDDIVSVKEIVEQYRVKAAELNATYRYTGYALLVISISLGPASIFATCLVLFEELQRNLYIFFGIQAICGNLGGVGMLMLILFGFSGSKKQGTQNLVNNAISV